MKKGFILLCIFCAAGWMSCSNSNNGANTGADSTAAGNAAKDNTNANNNMQTDTNAAANTTSQPLDDKTKEFVTKAAAGGMMEVQLGQTAQQNAADPRIKDFGNMMIKDHSAANDELKGILARKNFNVPDQMDKKEHKDMEDLTKKHGKDFDKAYIKMMVNDHKKDIKEFEDAAKDVTDPDIKAFASKTLPVLRTHLDSATAISKKY